MTEQGQPPLIEFMGTLLRAGFAQQTVLEKGFDFALSVAATMGTLTHAGALIVAARSVEAATERLGMHERQDCDSDTR